MKVFRSKEYTSARALFLFFSAFLIAGTSEAQVAAGNDASANRTSELAAAPSTYRLIGTVEGGGFVGAVLDDVAAGAQTFFRLKETLPDGSRIIKVRSDSISIKRSDGVVYELYTIHDMTAAPSTRPPATASSPAPQVTADQRNADMQTRAARPPRPDTRANQRTFSPASDTAAPGDARVRRVPRQQGRTPQPSN